MATPFPMLLEEGAGICLRWPEGLLRPGALGDVLADKECAPAFYGRHFHMDKHHVENTVFVTCSALNIADSPSLFEKLATEEIITQEFSHVTEGHRLFQGYTRILLSRWVKRT